MKAPDAADVLAALAAQWALLVAAAPGLDGTASTPLPGWDGALLLGHLCGTVERLVTTAAAVTALPTTAEATLDAVTWWTAPSADHEDGTGDADRLRTAVAAAREVLATADDTNRVVGPGIRLGDYARTRVVEAVVHGLDLGVTPHRAALRLTVRLLVEVLAARHPGRSVELRVPPFAAAQVIPGPRHTRGTPPAVVEAEPIAWVLVATGRRAFAAAVADGGIRASGGRSDLTPYLPLL